MAKYISMTTCSSMISKNPQPLLCPTLAIIVPCFNEEESVPTSVQILQEVLDGMKTIKLVSEESYLYFVDDGSNDSTWKYLHNIHLTSPKVRALKLSRNFGHQTALLAGLMAVKGRCDAAISIDADLQQDPLAIPEFVKKYIEGADVVFGVRNDRSSDGLFKRATATWFYSLMKVMGVMIIPHHADYRLLSNRAIEALAEHTEPNIFLRAICVSLGFKTETVYFDVRERAKGLSKYSFAKMLKLALDGITSFSVVPLRAIAVLGFLIFCGSLLMAFYVIYRSLVVGDTVPGWASTTLPIYVLGGIQILCMGIIGEYISQIVTAVKRRPRYIQESELF